MANNLTLNGTRSSKWLADMHEIYSHDPVGLERYHVSFFKWTFDFDRRSFVWTRWKSKCKVSTALGLKVIFKSLDAKKNHKSFCSIICLHPFPAGWSGPEHRPNLKMRFAKVVGSPAILLRYNLSNICTTNLSGIFV